MTVLTYEGDIPHEVEKRLEQVEMSAVLVILFDTAREFQLIRNRRPPK